MNENFEWSGVARAAFITRRLMEGRRFTTAEVQRLLGYDSWQGAYWLMQEISLALPLTLEEQEPKEWFLLDSTPST